MSSNEVISALNRIVWGICEASGILLYQEKPICYLPVESYVVSIRTLNTSVPGFRSDPFKPFALHHFENFTSFSILVIDLGMFLIRLSSPCPLQSHLHREHNRPSK